MNKNIIQIKNRIPRNCLKKLKYVGFLIYTYLEACIDEADDTLSSKWPDYLFSNHITLQSYSVK